MKDDELKAARKAALKLTLRERYALDAYYVNSGEVGAKEECYTMSLDLHTICSSAADLWTEKSIATKTSTFFGRKDVVSYLAVKKEDERRRKQRIDGGGANVDDIVAKDYQTIIKELELDRQRAKENEDEENYQKYSKLLLDYMKSSKEDVGTEDRINYYVPVVCVDTCPLYAKALSELKDGEELRPPQEKKMV